jgi:hypothetical protein
VCSVNRQANFSDCLDLMEGRVTAWSIAREIVKVRVYVVLRVRADVVRAVCVVVNWR